MLDGRILKVRFHAVYLPGSKIDPAYMGAIIFAVDVFVRVRLLPRAFRYGSHVVIIVGVVLFGNQAATQLANHFFFDDFYTGEQTVARIGDKRFFYHRSFIILFVYF